MADMAANFALVSAILLLSIAVSTQQESKIVETKYGQIQGQTIEFLGNKLNAYLGIPYAKPPVGELRFELPQPPEPWDKPLIANRHGPSCYQSHLGRMSNLSTGYSEDCLYLNIYAPIDAQKVKLPVMFWIHGGGLLFDSAVNPLYNPTALSALGNIIVVSINYRLGPLGFLYTGNSNEDIRANLGLWDQNFALRWTHENIASFGGDPNHITIFGESAGAWSVGSHLISPQSNTLFKNAILQSAAPYSRVQICPTKARKQTLKFASSLGCDVTNSKAVKACLKALPLDDFYKNDATTLHDVSFANLVYGDGDKGDAFLPMSAKEAVETGHFPSHVNLLTGVTSNEGSFTLYMMNQKLFDPHSPAKLDKMQIIEFLERNSPHPHLSRIAIDFYIKPISDDEPSELLHSLSMFAGDHFITCPTILFAEQVAEYNALRDGKGKVYGYYLTQKPRTSFIPWCNGSDWMSVCHADDLIYVFGQPLMEPEKYSDEDRALSRQMIKIWSSFARDGHPPLLFKDEEWPVFETQPRIISKHVELNARFAKGIHYTVHDDKFSTPCRDMIKPYLQGC